MFWQMPVFIVVIGNRNNGANIKNNNKSFTTVYYNLWFLTNTLFLFNLQDFKIPSDFSLEINKHQKLHNCGKNIFIHFNSLPNKKMNLNLNLWFMLHIYLHYITLLFLQQTRFCLVKNQTLLTLSIKVWDYSTGWWWIQDSVFSSGR